MMKLYHMKEKYKMTGRPYMNGFFFLFRKVKLAAAMAEILTAGGGDAVAVAVDL